MTAFDNATKFFAACEAAKGWAGCEQYVADNASFVAQSEPLVEINTVAQYCEWMAAFGNVTAPGSSYTLHASSYDEDSATALFFATFHGRHTGEGGPVPPTGMATNSHYVYALTMDADDKVAKMVKIWNAPWAMRELGWV
jgi:hypothetical protein